MNLFVKLSGVVLSGVVCAACSNDNAPPPAVSAPAASSGGWRVQLGAFGVPANADALWNRVKGRPEIAGHGRINVAAGKITKLQAGGFASQAEAQGVCARLSSAGIACIAARN